MSLDARFSLQRGNFSLGVSLQVAEGETLALLGPNGAGKSSTLRTLAGLHAIDHGHIRVNNEVFDSGRAATWVPPEQRNIGMVFQDHLLFPHLSARDNIAFSLRSRGRKLANAVADEWLHRMGLTHRSDALPPKLSGGEAQRIALARALAGKPKMLLLDEPLASVDASARLAMRKLLQAQLLTFPGASLLVTHDLNDALAIADRIAVIENGRVVQCGPIAELGQRPASRYVADLVGLNCFRGMCHGNTLTVDNGASIYVGTPHQGPAIATLHPRAVALFRERPSGSPRNIWSAPITGSERSIDSIRVHLGGDLPVVAEVTESAVRDLDLDAGGNVWVAIKATEFRVVPA